MVGELSAFLDRIQSAQGGKLDWGDGATAAPEVGAEGKPSRSYRVVLVEDDDDLRGSCREALELLGYDVKEARDGLEGLALILAEKPDVAIIDINLPGIDGYEVARRGREMLGSSLQLLAMTGYRTESDRREAINAGFDKHMSKPIDMTKIEEFLEKARLRSGPLLS